MNSKQSYIAIVPAAGVGSRMQQTLPKQYLLLSGKTILEHTVNNLLSHPLIEKVIIAVSKDDPYIYQLDFIEDKRIQLVIGGKERSDSVSAGLAQVDDECWVLVHDAARPCITHGDLDKLFALDKGSEQAVSGAILACPVVDTIKRSFDGTSIATTEDRSELWHALTPQFFQAGILKKAFHYAQENQITITDEASAMELMGYHPKLIAGRSDNLKITRPEDLALAEFYLQRLVNR